MDVTSFAWKILSEKSGRCGHCRIAGAWRFTYEHRGDIRSRGPLQQISGPPLPGAYCPEHGVDSLIAKFKEAAERSGEIDVWAESPRLSPLWLSASSSARHGLLIITDNAITYKAQRDKNARELKLANAAITDMQMRQRDVAALDAKYTKEYWC